MPLAFVELTSFGAIDMSETNRHGLQRSIPQDVKRAVRRDCGFGCVVCRRLPTHYDHFEPEFRDCTVHNPNGIALLCPTCHQDKTSGRLSAKRVAECRERASRIWSEPAWRTQSSGNSVQLMVGNNALFGQRARIAFGTTTLLEVRSTSDPVEPWTLAGTFVHGKGRIVRFEDSEVVVCRDNWDVELVGDMMTFRAAQSIVVLQLVLQPDCIRVEQLSLEWPSGALIHVSSNGNVAIDGFVNQRGGALRRLVFNNNRIVPGRSSGSLCHCDPTGVTQDMTFSGCMVGSHGFADLASLINFNDFLSPETLAVPGDE